MKRTATRHIARVRAAIAEVQASDLAAGVDARARRRTARVPPRRGDRAARSDRRPLPVPADRAAVPARRRRDRRDRRRPHVGLGPVGARGDGRRERRSRSAAHPRRQRRDARARDASRSPKAPTGSARSAPTTRRARSSHRQRLHRRAPASASSRWARRCARSSRRSAAARAPGARSAPCSRARRRRSSPPTSSTRPRAGKACRRSVPGSARPRSSSRRHDRHRRRRGERVAVPRGRVVRAVHAVQAGQPAHHRRARRRSRTSNGAEDDLDVVRKRIDTVTFGARCSLATQEQVVIGSILDAFGAELEARVEHTAARGAADGDRPDARPPRRRGRCSTWSTRASSPTGRSASTGRARPPPTASTTTAPTTKSSERCTIDRAVRGCARFAATTPTCWSRSTPTPRSCGSSAAASRPRPTKRNASCSGRSVTAGSRTSARPTRSSAGSACDLRTPTRASSATGWRARSGARASRPKDRSRCIAQAFTELGAERIWAQTMTVNVASRRVMERCGLRFVRTLPHRRAGSPSRDPTQGDVEYEITKAEWEQR